MQDKLQSLKDHICALSAQESFIHYKWFVEHHLNIVKRLANELCDLYPQADQEIVIAMVWLHDLGKILTSKNVSRTEESKIMLSESRNLLNELGFTPEFIDKVIKNLDTFEQATTRDLSLENIEVQVVSTADGCSHFMGPFMAIYWYECHDKSIEVLIEDNKKKATKDWNRKITLPEARQAFQNRYDQIMEQDVDCRVKKFFT